MGFRYPRNLNAMKPLEWIDFCRRSALVSVIFLLMAHTLYAEPRPYLLLEPAESRDDGFTFVVHGDLTGGERPGVFATAAAQIALLQPNFVISVGDLIEGDSENAQAMAEEWEDYERRARATGSQVYLVGGNHDLTSDLQRAVWKERYGTTYYHFQYGDALFLVLDTEDYPQARRSEVTRLREEALEVYANEGPEAGAQTEYARLPERTFGEIGEQQMRYFLDVIDATPDARWTFLFMHKAPWAGAGDRRFHKLEQALRARPYTVFHGHEHAYGYQQRQGRDYLRLATTGGSQAPKNGRSADHVTLVTVGADVTVAHIELEGIRDKTGVIPSPMKSR